MKFKDISSLVWLIPIAMLVVAVLKLPYGYYTLLRLVITGAAGFIAYVHFENRAIDVWSVLLVMLALLFNPLFPVHLKRDSWFYIDLGSAILLGAHWFRFRRA